MPPFLARLRAAAQVALGRKPDDRLIADLFPNVRASPPVRGTAEFLTAYSSMPWLRATVHRVAVGVASTEWELFGVKGPRGGNGNGTGNGNGGGKFIRHQKVQRARLERRKSLLRELRKQGRLVEIEEHMILDLLHNPNPFMTGTGFRRLTEIYIDLIGEAFWIIERDGLGVPVGLWPVPPHWILDVPSPRRPVFFLQLPQSGWGGEVPMTEVIWFVDPDPFQPYGRGAGTARSLADELETDEYAAKHTKSWFYNSARPDVIVTVEGARDPDLKAAEQRWLDRHQGFFRAYKPFFVSRKIKVDEIGQTFRDMQFTQLRQHERDTIIQVFGLPPEILGVLESSNRACYDEETECLTDRGWLRHDELQPGDRVAAYDPLRRELRFEAPRRVVRYPYRGPMLHFASPSGAHGPRGNVDVCVTPDHRMLVRSSMVVGGWCERRASELGDRPRRWRVLAAAPLAAPDPEPVVLRAENQTWRARSIVTVPVDVWAPLLGLFVTEGVWNRYGTGHTWLAAIAQSGTANPDKVAWINALVARFPIRPSRVVNSDGTVRWQWSHRPLVEHLLAHCGAGGAPTKRLPGYVRAWPAWAQRRVLDAMVLGDGTAVGVGDAGDWTAPGRNVGVRRRTWASWQLVSTSRLLLEDAQEVAVKAGLRAGRVRLQSAAEGPRVACYRMGISEHVEPELPAPREVAYDGLVWCLQTSTGWFVTRRGGCVAIHGNTIEAADYIMAKYVLVPRLELIRETLQERLVPMFDERIVLDYVSPVQEDRASQLEAAKAQPAALRIDEWRELAGFEELEDGSGEGYIVPIGVTIVDSLDATPPPAPALPPGDGEDGDPSPDDGNGEGGDGQGDEGNGQGDEQDGGEEGKAGLRIQPGALGKPPRALFVTSASDDFRTAMHRIAEAMEPRWRRRFAQLVEQAQGRVDLQALEHAIASRNAREIERLVEEAGLARELGGPEGIRNLALATVDAAANAANAELAGLGIDISWVSANPYSIAWANRYAARLVTEVSERTRAAVRAIVERGFRQGLAPRDMARLIRGVVGLRSDQAEAVARFRERLEAGGVEGEALERRTERYAESQLRKRALLIARTETIAAANMGQQLLWQEGRKQGVLSDQNARKVWITTPDDRLDAEVCEPMPEMAENADVPIDGSFTTGDGRQVLAPPAHPNCRCAMGLKILTRALPGRRARKALPAGTS